jgi:hypothetical protein
MRTFEEIRALLAQKFSDEKKRLKSYGTKTSSFDLANAVARYVESLMSESRYKELKQLEKKLGKHDWYKGGMDIVRAYIRERKKATKNMAKAIHNVAERDSKNRPWKKHKHKKRKHDS